MFKNEGSRFFKGGKPKPKPFTTAEIAASSNPEAFEALVNFARETANKPKEEWEKEPSVWEMLNNPDLFPPKGKNILPNFKDLTDSRLVRNSIYSAVVILNTLSLAPDTAESKEMGKKIDSKQIEWALEAFEKIDPVNILLYEREQKKSRGQEDVFSKLEQSILTWNIFHEARGEGEAGWEAVLLNNLNRMRSASFPATAEGVAFQRFQFSYTRDILSGENNQDKKDNLKSYLPIRATVEKILDNNMTLDEKISALEKSLANKGFNFPSRSVEYNTTEIMPLSESFMLVLKNSAPEKYKNVKIPDPDKFKSLNDDTQARLQKAANEIEAGKRKFEIIGNHIHF